jgi:ABC-type dipeptide/oligopeptide/nickel transport system permease component
MTAYLIRRIGSSLVILIGISIFVFVLPHSPCRTTCST